MVQWLQQPWPRRARLGARPQCLRECQLLRLHYEPTAAAHAPIRNGDFLLIDIWAQLATADSRLLRHHLDRRRRPRTHRARAAIFNTVRDARDAAIKASQQAFAAGQPIAGWEADDAARAVIRDAGFGDYFTHRTGHNIATSPRQRRAPRQSGDPRRAPAFCPIPASPSSPASTLPRVRHPQRIDMIARKQSPGHRPHPDGAGPRLAFTPSAEPHASLSRS